MYIQVTRIATLAIALCLSAAGAARASDTEPPASENWPELRQQHFGDRPIAEDDGVVALEAPYRAEDAAVVPIAIRDRLPPDDQRRIRKLWLVIDNNPVPMSAELEFGPAAPSADIATRVRVNAYTHMRAVAETSDGALHMATEYVKASGGCSAPASKDPGAARAGLGQIRLRRISDETTDDDAERVQMLVRHPNHTGLQMNQLTRLTIPAHYIDAIEIDQGDQSLLRARMTFSLSENPSLRFSRPRAAGTPLHIRVHDTEGNRFTADLAARSQ